MQKLTIVIIGQQISDRMILLGRLWKKSGFKVVLIYCTESILFTNLKEEFDIIIKAQNSEEIISIGLKINNHIFHYFNYGPDQLGLNLYSNNIKYIYDYKDLFANIVHNTINQNSLAVELEIVKNAAAITRRDEQIFYYLQINHINYNVENILYIPSYFIEDIEYEKLVLANLESQSRSESIKIIMSGGYLSENNPNMILYEGISFLIRKIVNADVHIDLIGNFSSNLSGQANSFPLLNDLIEKKWVNILPSMRSDDFDHALLKYDFAMHMFNFDVTETNFTIQFENSKLLDYGNSARIYSFIKANLPIIIGKSLPHVKNTFNKSGFIINYEDSYDNNFTAILKNYKLMNYKKRIYPHRIKYNDKNALENFNTTIFKIEKELYESN